MGLLQTAERRRGARNPEATELSDYRSAFVQESDEHLDEWEESLLRLEGNPSDREELDRIFRTVHTLKGSSGFIGLGQLEKLTHRLESSLQRLRETNGAPTDGHIELMFTAVDLCRRMVRAFESGRPFTESIDSLAEQFHDLYQGAGVGGGTSGSGWKPSDIGVETRRTPVSSSAADGPVLSNARKIVVKLFVSARGREAFLRAYLARTRLSSIASIVSEEPVAETVRDAGRPFAYSLTVATSADETRLREALNIDQIEIRSIDQLDESTDALQDLSMQGERPVTSHDSPGRGQEVVRVSVERLDSLLNIVGELVVQNSRFLSVAEALRGRFGSTGFLSELDVNTERLQRISRDLQEGIMKIRMLPLSNVFRRFHRVAREAAKTTGKEVSLEVFGDDTEVDKKVIDRIGDPLVHLVRNAVDHGIESSTTRVGAGKLPVGVVRLGAYHEGDHICVEVSDDGKGLDREAVLRVAVRRGLLRAAEADGISESDILQLIFLPGFSTADKVTELSGRGVGMDAVKRAIEDLGGTIRVRSALGRGTTVTMSLPLTTSIVAALLVQVGEVDLALPLTTVREVLNFGDVELGSVGTNLVIRLRDKIIGLVSLNEALSMSDNFSVTRSEVGGPVVVVEVEGHSIALAVDRVLGSREIVIKSLSRHYREVPGLLGASILGNGRIALIVDVDSIVREHSDSRAADETSPDGSMLGSHERIDAEFAGLPSAPVPVNAGYRAQSDESVDEPGPALTDDGLSDFDEINSTGALQASAALSQMLHSEVRVSFPQSSLCVMSEVSERLARMGSGIGTTYVGIRGELCGGMIVALPTEGLAGVMSAILGSADASASEDPPDPSVFSEFANILSASFINAIADAAGISLHSESPEVLEDEARHAVESISIRPIDSRDRVLLTTAILYFSESEEVSGNILFYLDPESMERLMSRLGSRRRAGELAGGTLT